MEQAEVKVEVKEVVGLGFSSASTSVLTWDF
jgi:hypothetical protein